jgi:putative membrane protein
MGCPGPLMMILWLVVAVAILGLAITGIIWLVRSMTGKEGPPAPTRVPADPAYDELRRRYAAGDIGRDEYLQRKSDLAP